VCSYPRVLTGRLQGFIRSLDPEIIIQPQRTKYKRLQRGLLSPEGARTLSNVNSASSKFPSKPTDLQHSIRVACESALSRFQGSAWPLPRFQVHSLILNSMITGSSKNARTTAARLDAERPYIPSLEINYVQEFLVGGK
jgi:hypothetical protein